MTVICSNALMTRRPPFAAQGSVASSFVRSAGRPAPVRKPNDRKGSIHYSRYFPDRVDAPLSASRLLGLGCSEVQPGDRYPVLNLPLLYRCDWRPGRVLPDFQVVLLSNAAGEFESEATGRVQLLGDVLIFLRPGTWHRYRPLAGGGWSERWISLHGDTVRQIFDQACITEANSLYVPADPGKLRAAFDILLDATEARDAEMAGPIPLALHFLQEAIWQATEVELSAVEPQAMPREETIADEIVRRAIKIIWNHEHSPPLGVNDIAKQLPVTRRTLDRRFSEAIGRTVLDEINACRICRAKRLLAETDMLIKAVAYRAGFPSRERLRLAFLSYEGMPPSEFRAAARQRASGM